MAFVFRSERKIDLSGKENGSLGPGAYVGHRELKPKPQVHQPFQAMTGRDHSQKSNVSQATYNPGPGQYQPALGFEHISKSMQSAKNLSMYGLEKFGITVIKPSNAFVSRVDRFSEKVVKEKSLTPGPGQYSQDAPWTKPNKNGPKPQWQMVTWNKMQNPPSIPSHENIFGYEENNNGELVKQKNSDKVFTGVKNDTVGPGNYDIVKGLGATKKGPAWHVPKNQAKVPSSKDINVPGPGYYNSDKVDIFPIYKYKPSSVFVSKVERDRLLKEQRKRLPPKPSSQQQHSRNMIDDDYFDEDEDDNYAPGPGSYYNNQQSTTFKVKSIPERLQFFGSTVERFNGSTMKQGATGTIGPGAYTVAASTVNKKMRSSNQAPFASTNQRFIDQKQQIEVPGPGTYQNKTLVEDIVKKPWGKQGVFGSTEKRFVAAQTLHTPGPGQYKPERSQNVLDKKKENNIKRSSSMFISSTKRNPYDQPKSEEQVAIVQYDVNTNTISNEVKKKVEAGIGNSLLTDLRSKRQINVGFSSNAPRFNEKKPDEAEAFLGPGYYEQQNSFEPRNSVTVSSTIKTQQFLSQAPRFNQGQKTAVGETPGPGHYSNEDMNGWFKRTYNMIFTE